MQNIIGTVIVDIHGNHSSSRENENVNIIMDFELQSCQHSIRAPPVQYPYFWMLREFVNAQHVWWSRGVKIAQITYWCYCHVSVRCVNCGANFVTRPPCCKRSAAKPNLHSAWHRLQCLAYILKIPGKRVGNNPKKLEIVNFPEKFLGVPSDVGGGKSLRVLKSLKIIDL